MTIEKKTYYSVSDFFSDFGGKLSTLRTFLIIIPTAIYFTGFCCWEGEYTRHMTSYFYGKQKNKKLSRDEMKKKYLKVVSHEGILTAHD